jgi:hypothetical protein
MKEDGMGGVCSTHGRDEKYIQNSGWKNWKVRDHSEGLGADGEIILEWILGTQSEAVWIGFI